MEATLQENDQWLSMYLDSISGLKDTKKPDYAITEALKTSSTKRRGRSRMDVRDVFGNNLATVRLSPLASQFNTASMRSLRLAKRRSSQYGSLQGNTLNMAIAQMNMMPPKSPYLTNVMKGNHAETTSLTRSNSAAAKTAAAVKRLQALAGSPTPQSASQLMQMRQDAFAPRPGMFDPLSASSDITMASPGVPLSAMSDMSVVISPPRSAAPQVGRFTHAAAPMPTLRDMILNQRSSPTKPPPIHERALSAGQRSKPFSTINVALGSLTLEEQQKQKRQKHQNQQPSLSSGESSPTNSSGQPLDGTLRSRSVTSNDTDKELTRSEDEVREGLQNVRIAFTGSNSTTELRNEASYANEVSDDIASLYRDIDEVANMLPSSQNGSQHSDADEEQDEADDNAATEDEEHDAKDKPSGVFVDVVIDQEPMDVRLDSVAVEEDDSNSSSNSNSGNSVKHKAGSPGKRKLSGDERSLKESAGPTLSRVPRTGSRMPAPSASSTASSLSRTRGRGRGKVRLGMHNHASALAAPTTGLSRKPVLRTQTSNASSVSSQRSREDMSRAPADVPSRSDSRIGHHVAGGVNKSRNVATTTSSSNGVSGGGGRVAEFRRKFETADNKAPSSSSSAFSNPVVAMRPGYSVVGSNSSGAQTPVSSKSHVPIGVPRTQLSKPMAGRSAVMAAGQKSSTAAMREAARRAEAARINAAASRKPTVQQQSLQVQGKSATGGNEMLFKNVARNGQDAAKSINPSQSSTKSQASDRRPRPAPLAISSNSANGVSSKSLTKSNTASDTELTDNGAMPIPISKGKAPDVSTEDTETNAKTAGSSTDSGRWGLSSVISMLSPSSWKSQTNLAQSSSTATAAAAETPTAAISKQKINMASPYDVNSPQTPYRPRPEHGGERQDLVMPSYQDMAVPLRRSSSGRSSSVSSRHSANYQHQTPTATDKRLSRVGSHNQKLIRMSSQGRLSGVSSFRSSFFSDDEGASTRRITKGLNNEQPSMARTKSTTSLRSEQTRTSISSQMITPLRPSRSSEYVSIIPVGSDSPPEIESDYSDEYSEDEFSPAPKLL
ncbi:hypothetical protein GGI07_001854 [Coemansia sp. Benny D115]|nr:hypothetical protein GGI07_001854 [Coemansia sp. Benny D115]